MTNFPDNEQSKPSDCQESELLGSYCLDYLISDPEELARFMGLSGYTPQTLRDSVDTTELQTALLNYFVSNEAALLAMCANAGIPTARLMRCWGLTNAHI
ncbi:MAG: DUF3572 domain-containing protein [Devosiaceae bacterium]|nr:DUF3572 domain-containing protein [Devosiaceae bacterium]